MKLKLVGFLFGLSFLIASPIYSQTFFNRSHLSFTFGGATDLSTMENEFLNPFFTNAQINFVVPVYDNHGFGIEFGFDSRKLKNNKITNFIDQDTLRHSQLMDLTSGHHNTLQLGAIYSYTKSGKRYSFNFKLGSGGSLITKSDAHFEYKPASGTLPYTEKRMSVGADPSQSNGWGGYGSAEINLIRRMGGIGFMIGARYVYGVNVINNIYSEEYNENGVHYNTEYSETFEMQKIDVHVGIAIPLVLF